MLLILLVYLSFISLGLPDSLLGAAWPLIQVQRHWDQAYLGWISTLTALMTILSTLMTNRVQKRWGTGKLTAISVAFTGMALVLMALSQDLWGLMLAAIPYGLGAGAVDAALNHYVAQHYSNRHMNWLHCMWGLGASLGPLLLGLLAARGFSWTATYLLIGAFQLGLALVLWVHAQKFRDQDQEKQDNSSKKDGKMILQGRVWQAGVSFLLYCFLEASAGLWAASFFVATLGLEPQLAASLASLFYLGITFGRALSGFVAHYLPSQRLLQVGMVLLFLGTFLMFLPHLVPRVIAFCLLGLGCAPVYPTLIHITPERFGPERAQAIIGFQMSMAYVGVLIAPPIMAYLFKLGTIHLLPLYLLILGIGLSVLVPGIYEKGSSSHV